MSAKSVMIKMPMAKSAALSADDWVKERTPDISEALPTSKVTSLAPQPEAMKRFTIDVTENLHKRIKSKCAQDGTKMADVIREMLEKAFPRNSA